MALWFMQGLFSAWVLKNVKFGCNQHFYDASVSNKNINRVTLSDKLQRIRT